MVRQRPVVHEAEVEARRKWVRAGGRNLRLGGHPRVAKSVRAVERLDVERLDEGLGATDLLVDLDRLTRAHDLDVGVALLDPRLDRRSLGMRNDHGMVGAALDALAGTKHFLDALAQCAPIEIDVVVLQRQLGVTSGNGFAIERDPRTVRTSIAHLKEHRREQRTKVCLYLGVLGKESNNSAHTSLQTSGPPCVAERIRSTGRNGTGTEPLGKCWYVLLISVPSDTGMSNYTHGTARSTLTRWNGTRSLSAADTTD